MALIIKLFVVAFFLNLLYELIHSLLYKTCHEATLPRYIYLILKAALFDGFVIALIYFATKGNMILFAICSVLFAAFWEIYSLKKGKWEYSASMPKILGVGITPLLQLVTTGIASLYIVFYF